MARPSGSGMSEDDVLKLLQEIDDLKKKLEKAEQLNVAADDRAKYFASADEETPTGRTVKQLRCKNPTERDVELQEWVEYDEPTYYMKIDMPPVGGVQMVIDGQPLQHGQTYEMTIHRVRQVKEIMYRLRAHEASIHGEDEDKWRPTVTRTVNKNLVLEHGANRGH